ncbi:uncharacterized protein HMPREF1120_05102 [Exophiala dermatitidis NIH/UT8656]|uniref:Uncharacterized protein n=1 Tax=Exophiala dermatitidis (strain ATCC 34100 / CBS 525.76 / NIH/UT8656) TaxID=858893 RepID=H6BZI9_EXODN|nr:uncharacterized protein HMPREF1120_05102 [Exophiala dermatitidis NIH/UT8656]EHY57052.1 hypothetical protein HMPREF1120_05102 [Exophiala dermatitidis NIH/UT8656]
MGDGSSCEMNRQNWETLEHAMEVVQCHYDRKLRCRQQSFRLAKNPQKLGPRRGFLASIWQISPILLPMSRAYSCPDKSRARPVEGTVQTGCLRYVCRYCT